MYKIAISDLDGTLLNSEHKISPQTQKSIAHWIESGKEFVIATGRHHIEAAYLQASIKSPLYLITSNGARIHDKTGQVIFEGNLQPEIASYISAHEFDKSIQVSIFTDSQWYANFEHPDQADIDTGAGFDCMVQDLTSIDPNSVIKMLFWGDREMLEDIHEHLDDKFKDQLNLTFSLPTCLEVMHVGVDKAAATKIVVQACGLKLSESIAFGDGMNDLEMLKVAGRGVLMENSQPDLLAQFESPYQTLSNNDHGVASTLSAFI